MAIHYANYEKFSKGQGFVGALCRPVSAMAVSARWLAVDCADCRSAIVGRLVRHVYGGSAVPVREVSSQGVTVGSLLVTWDMAWDAFDRNWAPA